MPGMVYVTGMSVYAYYYVTGCDPLASGHVRTGNEVMGRIWVLILGGSDGGGDGGGDGDVDGDS